MKKTNNKGFSLVELIVVVAIMAVLMVVVGPQLLRYVERSRIQRDNTAISEIANAVKIAMADENINNNVTTGKTITPSAGVYTFDSSDTLENELIAVLGTTVSLSSNSYRTGTQPVLTITKSGLNITITGTNLLDQDGSAYGADDSGSLVY